MQLKPNEKQLLEAYALAKYFDEAPLADRMQIDGRSIFDAIPQTKRDCIDRVVARIPSEVGHDRADFIAAFWQRYQ